MAYLECLEEYVDEFACEMKCRLADKRPKYGDTWKNRPVEPTAEYDHQNKRFFDWLQMKYDSWKNGGEPMNFIDVACEAMICFVREKEALMQERLHNIVG